MLIAAALAASATGTPLAADKLELQSSVRTLAALQDRSATGDAEAARMQARLISQIENDIRLAPRHELGTEGNLRAIAMLLLSGANPNFVEAQTLNLPMDEDMRNLINGALAYARADREGAATLLAKVNVEHLPPTLAGRVALVRSIIGASENASRAIDDLYVARELMPGTLVEEASLRRCVAFAARLADKKSLRFCSGRYIRRFPNSLYFKEFAEAFAEAVAQTGFGEGGEFRLLLDSLERMGTKDRRGLLLRLSRSCLTHGRHALAAALATEAQSLSLAGSADMSRARLYQVAAALAVDHDKDHRHEIDLVNASALAEDDATLLADVQKLAHAIAVKPEMSIAQANQLAASTDAPAEDANLAKALQAARQALALAEQQNPVTPQKASK